MNSTKTDHVHAGWVAPTLCRSASTTMVVFEKNFFVKKKHDDDLPGTTSVSLVPLDLDPYLTKLETFNLSEHHLTKKKFEPERSYNLGLTISIAGKNEALKAISP